jgi:hypothetical protein
MKYNQVMSNTQQVWFSQTIGELAIVTIFYKAVAPLCTVRGRYGNENNMSV